LIRLFGRWQELFTVSLRSDETIFKWRMIVGAMFEAASLSNDATHQCVNGGREPNGAEYLDPKA
jgi:hypothetical protein